MKKNLVLTVAFLLCSTLLFASEIEGKWTTTIETDNGPYTFFAEFVVKGEVISGTLSSDMGSVEISEGKIEGNEFEYSFSIEGASLKHKGKLVDGKLEVKSSGDYGEMEFIMTKVKKE